jgi:hypothetical protein
MVRYRSHNIDVYGNGDYVYNFYIDFPRGGFQLEFGFGSNGNWIAWNIDFIYNDPDVSWDYLSTIIYRYY